METKEYRTYDKTDWGRGEWQSEPDKMQFVDEATGLPCLIVRTSLGHLCGYVGVAPGHPWHGKGYDDAIGACNKNCTDDYHSGHRIGSCISVHGGLTFADACRPHEEADYQKFMASMDRSREEAKRYPKGDAARRLKEWGDIKDFAAWKERCEQTGICHLPAPGEPEHVWWFGFDCAHFGDCSPGMDTKYGGLRDGSYKTVNYVKRECQELAQQLAAVA